MLNIIFNIVGIGFVIYGVFILKSRPSKFEEDEYLGDYLNKLESFQEVLDKQQSAPEPSSLVDLGPGAIYQPSPSKAFSGQDNSQLSRQEALGPSPRPKSLVVDRKSQPLEEKNPNSGLKQEVLSLSQMGISNEEIAKKMKKSVREIDILLKLNKIG